MQAPLLLISDLHVSVEGKEVVRGVGLTIHGGEIHAVMGPNGSGKSTLVHALMGHPRYVVTQGNVRFRGEDLLALSPDERAKRGLFLAFQYPKEIAGVSLRSFLLAAYRSTPHGRKRLSPLQFQKLLLKEMEQLKMDPAFAERSLNQGFSGGEKKKTEILQLRVLRPLLALLDETDSGLDIDALKIVAEGVNSLRSERVMVSLSNHTRSGVSPVRQAPPFACELRRGRQGDTPFSALIVTHYARILEHITPDCVHVMVGGQIVESGGPTLASSLEREGYRKYGEAPKSPFLSLEIE